MKVEQLLPTTSPGQELFIDRETLRRVGVCSRLASTDCLARYRLIHPGQPLGAMIEAAKARAPELPTHHTRVSLDEHANVIVLLMNEAADPVLWKSEPMTMEDNDYRDAVNVLARFNAWHVRRDAQIRSAHSVDWLYPLIPEANTYRSMFESLTDGDFEVHLGDEIRWRISKMIAPLGLKPPHRRMTCRIPEYPYLHEVTSVSIPTNAGVVFASTEYSSLRHALAMFGPGELTDLLERYVALLQGIHRPIFQDQQATPSTQRAQSEAVAECSPQGDLFGGTSSTMGSTPITPLATAAISTVAEAANEDEVTDESPISKELGLLRITGQRADLPTVQLRLYPQIKTLLLTAGASYKRGGFEFPSHLNPIEVIECLRAGETVNPKKDYQFFETPDELAIRVVEATGDVRGRRVLEPSAGRGKLADLAKAAGAEVVTVEAWDLNAKVLRDKGYVVHEGDFLSLTPADLGLFDAIVANPPFSRNADIRHVEHMLTFLKPGGVLSVITSAHWDIANHAHAKRFKQWIANAGVTVEEVPAGTFKASGTSVPTRHLIYINNKSAIAA